MKKVLLACSVLLATACGNSPDQNLKLNELEYFETQGVNVLVYSNLFSGGFNDEKNSGIELIHHGVRTAQGGAIRLSNTPEQWDLVPSTPSRKVNIEDNSIEVAKSGKTKRSTLQKRRVSKSTKTTRTKKR